MPLRVTGFGANVSYGTDRAMSGMYSYPRCGDWLEPGAEQGDFERDRNEGQHRVVRLAAHVQIPADDGRVVLERDRRDEARRPAGERRPRQPRTPQRHRLVEAVNGVRRVDVE